MWTYSPHYLLLPSTVCDFGRMHHLNLLCVTLTQAPWLKCCVGYVLANLAALLRVHSYAAPLAHNTNPPFLALGIGELGIRDFLQSWGSARWSQLVGEPSPRRGSWVLGGLGTVMSV